MRQPPINKTLPVPAFLLIFFACALKWRLSEQPHFRMSNTTSLSEPLANVFVNCTNCQLIHIITQYTKIIGLTANQSKKRSLFLPIRIEYNTTEIINYIFRLYIQSDIPQNDYKAYERMMASFCRSRI